MNRPFVTSREFIEQKSPIVPWFAFFAYVAFLILLLASLWINLAGLNPEGAWIKQMLAAVGGVFLLLSAIATIFSTFILFRAEGRIVDRALFITVLWVVPFVGVSLALGHSKFRRLLERR